MELEAFVRTTGGDGLHVHVPIARRHDHAEVRAFCNFLATALERSTVGLVTTEASPACRHGVYVDCKMNGRGQQVASVYSLRPTPTAAVSTPLRWDELNGDLDPAAFTMDVVVERIEQGGDLFAPVLHGRARLSTALAKVRRGKPKTS